RNDRKCNPIPHHRWTGSRSCCTYTLGVISLMDITKYSQGAVERIKTANKIAIRNNNPQVSDIHLFYSILLKPSKNIREFLENLDINLQKLKSDAENAISKIKNIKGVSNLY